MRSRSPSIVANFGPLLQEHRFSTGISGTLLVAAQRNLAALGVWPVDTYSPNLVNFGPDSRDPAIPCGDTHLSFTDALAIIVILGVHKQKAKQRPRRCIRSTMDGDRIPILECYRQPLEQEHCFLSVLLSPVVS